MRGSAWLEREGKKGKRARSRFLDYKFLSACVAYNLTSMSLSSFNFCKTGLTTFSFVSWVKVSHWKVAEYARQAI